jgi:xanthine dehydrogenase YagR molybdenum-binding subunit
VSKDCIATYAGDFAQALVALDAAVEIVGGLKNGLAEQLGIEPDKMHVISPCIGGAFGSRGSMTQRTALVAVAARRLNRPVKLVPTRARGFTITHLPSRDAASRTTASVCNALAKACEDIRGRIAAAAVAANDGRFAGKDPAALRLSGGRLIAPDGTSEPLAEAMSRAANGAVEAFAESVPHGVPPDGLKKLYQGHPALAGGAKLKDRIRFAFGAEFVEIRVQARTREIRVPRVVGAFAAGTIVVPVTAESQLMGGLIWGVSSALHEATEIDRRAARYTNTDLAENMIPVNADIVEAKVILVPETDSEVNPLGVKGIGELGNVGTNAAVANAVYHATGVRLRELPIRLENLLV